jgi:hypothetical protein
MERKRKESKMTQDVLCSGDVTLVNLSVVLEDACLAHDLTQEEIRIRHELLYRARIVIDKTRQWLMVEGEAPLNPESTREQRLILCNQISMDALWPKVALGDDRVTFSGIMPFSRGLSRKGFLRSLRNMVGSFARCHADFDPEQKVLLRDNAPQSLI